MADLQAALLEKRWRRYWPKTEDPAELHQAFVAFVTECWYIKVPGKQILLPITPEQSEAARRWLEHRYCINLKARQIGYSTLVGAFTFWETFGYGNRQEILLSKGEHEAQVLLQKAKYGLRFLPKWLLARGPKVLTNNTEKIAFDNESSIESLPSKDDPARGETVWRIFVDELGKLPNPEEAWGSIEPVADVGGRIVMLGTAQGWGSFFHSQWVSAKLHENGFDAYFAPWSAAKHRDDKWYEQQVRKFKNTPWLLHQEYPRNDDEAWMKSGNAVFDLDKLQEHEVNVFAPRRFSMMKRSQRAFDKSPAEYGDLRIFKEPEPHTKYGVGADIAEGLEHGDYSCVQILEAKTGEQCAVWHGHMDPDIFGEEVIPLLSWWFNTALCVPENNNHGLSTIKAMQRVGYPLIYRQRRLQDRKEHKTEMLGWRTTASTKPYVMAELNAAIREDDLILHDAETIMELKTFVRDGKKMNGSPHDDRVMALALANEARRWVFSEEYRTPEEKPGPGTIGYYLRQVEKLEKDLRPTKALVGAHNGRKGW